jgi:hypothetical protein
LESLKGRDKLEDLGIVGSMPVISKLVVQEYGMRVWIEFSWIMEVPSARLL